MQFIQNFIQKLYAWYGKRNVIIVASTILVLIVVGIVLKLTSNGSEVEVAADTSAVVELKSVSELQNGGSSLSILGTVEATNEARLQTEAGGRVTAVYADLGDTVRAGTVLATIENSREQAAVLQAEGVYEAARAGAQAGGVSVETASQALEEAEIAAKIAYRSAFTTSDDIIRNFTDEFFSNPDSSIPGLKLSDGNAPALTKERIEIGAILNAWRTKMNATTVTSEETFLTEAESHTTRISVFVTTLSTLLAEEDSDDALTESDIATYKARFSAARGQLDGALSSISGARNALNGAKSGYEQAQIAGANGDVSLSDAQVKQALGSLRLAQANLEKTIVRTPISGTVNALTLKVGTFVGMQEPAAVISNEGGLEVKAYVTEDDIRVIRVGDAVVIEKDVRGVVTQVGSALDTVTKKIEIRVGIEGAPDTLTNGQSVTVFLTRSLSETATNTQILLPITSIKMTPDGAVIFTVNNENKLVSHTVVLGAIIGDQVVIEEGATNDMKIVLDARGLRADESVEIK